VSLAKEIGFILLEMGLHPKFLSRGLRRSSLCFIRMILTEIEEELV
jgi:hypothetical protein